MLIPEVQKIVDDATKCTCTSPTCRQRLEPKQVDGLALAIQSATAKRCAEIAEQKARNLTRVVNQKLSLRPSDSPEFEAYLGAAEAIRKEFLLSEITKGRE